MSVILKDVRIAFPNLFQPQEFPGGGEAKFGATFLIGKDNEELLGALEKEIIAKAQEKWGDPKYKETLKTLQAGERICLRDGDTKANYDGYEGNMFVSCSSKNKPLVIDRDKKELEENAGRPYGGCYVNAKIEIWCQSNKYGKRINASVTGVQFVRDGDAFSGSAPASKDDFDSLDAGDPESGDDLL